MGYRATYQSQGFGSSTPGITWAVHVLILTTVAAHAAQLVLFVPLGHVENIPRGSFPSHSVVGLLGFSTLFLRGYLWQPFTYLFLHAGLMHLFMNMLWLYMFGPDVERLLGTRQFFRFYFFCGAVGVLLSLTPPLLGLAPSPPVIGASGAVMGVLIAFAIADPERQLFLFPLPFPINARGLIFIVIVLNLFSALGGGPSSVSTHFGGMGAGFLYMKLAPYFVRRWPRVRFSRQWFRSHHRPRRRAKNDTIGEEVDKILRSHETKWRD